MIPRNEASAGLYGAWLLAKRQPEGLMFFNDSREGFVRSFWALVVASIFDLVLEAVGGVFSGPNGVALPLVVMLISYVVGATAFPVAMASVTTELGRGDRWLRFIVAYNWSAVLRAGLFLPAALLVIAAPALHPLLAGVTIALLIYQTYVTHVALAVSPMLAGAIVLLDVLLDGAIGLVARYLMGTAT
jgi:hypothetical protein